MTRETNGKEKLLRLPEVKTRTGLSRTTLYALMSEGKFPRNVPLGLRCVGWLESEIDDWIAMRIANRQTS